MNASCQCGAVHFVTPTVVPLSLYHCHCTECRAQSASAFGTSAIFPTFALPQDQPIACWTRKTDSGGIMDCFFCNVCGTRLLHKTRGSDTVSVKGGCIGGLQWKDAKHIWCKSAVVPIAEGAEKWEAEPEK